LLALIRFLPTAKINANLRSRFTRSSSSSRNSRPAVRSRGDWASATTLSNDQTGHDPASRKRSRS
jgi:hypothetical protein